MQVGISWESQPAMPAILHQAHNTLPRFCSGSDALQPLWNLAKQPQGLIHPYLQQLDTKDPALLDIWTISKPPDLEESTLKLEVKLKGQHAWLSYCQKAGLGFCRQRHVVQRGSQGCAAPCNFASAAFCF